MKKCLLLFCLLLTSLGSMAYDAEIDGIYYNLNFNDDEAEVVNGNYSGDIIIPESVTYSGNTYPVTSIGKYAFDGCSSLTSVIIGNGVTYIDAIAFGDCSGLTDVYCYAENVPNTEGYQTFDESNYSKANSTCQQFHSKHIRRQNLGETSIISWH